MEVVGAEDRRVIHLQAASALGLSVKGICLGHLLGHLLGPYPRIAFRLRSKMVALLLSRGRRGFSLVVPVLEIGATDRGHVPDSLRVCYGSTTGLQQIYNGV